MRFLTAGESHGPELLTVVEGLPSGIPIRQEALDEDLARRSRRSELDITRQAIARATRAAGAASRSGAPSRSGKRVRLTSATAVGRAVLRPALRAVARDEPVAVGFAQWPVA